MEVAVLRPNSSPDNPDNQHFVAFARYEMGSQVRIDLRLELGD